jgi:hypothetical protein
MNAVEIEEAVSQLADAPFDATEFPYAFLEAFGNKSTTIKKLRSTAKSSTSNHSDLGGVLQRNHIHIKTCPPGEVADTLSALRNSPATARQKAKFILATDGQEFQAENLVDGETVACDYADFTTTSASSSRWPASPRSSRSARTPSTSRPLADSIVCTSSSSAPTPIGTPPPAAKTSTTSSPG